MKDLVALLASIQITAIFETDDDNGVKNDALDRCHRWATSSGQPIDYGYCIRTPMVHAPVP